MAKWEVVRHGLCVSFERVGDRIAMTCAWCGQSRTAMVDFDYLHFVIVGRPFSTTVGSARLTIQPVEDWIGFDLEDPIEGDRSAAVPTNEYREALRLLR